MVVRRSGSFSASALATLALYPLTASALCALFFRSRDTSAKHIPFAFINFCTLGGIARVSPMTTLVSLLATPHPACTARSPLVYPACPPDSWWEPRRSLFVALEFPKQSISPFLSIICALSCENTKVPARPGGARSAIPISLTTRHSSLVYPEPRRATKSFRIRTYRRTPRFSRNRPKLSFRNPFRIRTYRNRARNYLCFQHIQKAPGGGGCYVN